MSLFSPKSHTFLGVDIGVSGIKLVEFAPEHGRAKLMTYGYSERVAGDPVSSPIDNPQGTGELLKKIMSEAGVKTTHAMTSLPSSSIFSAIITVPARREEKEMKPYIHAEAAKLTPIPIADMITYSTFVDPLPAKDDQKKKQQQQAAAGKNPIELLHEIGERKPGYVRVLVTGAAKTMVEKYLQIFKVAGLSLDAIDTESFGLIRSLVGRDRGAVLLVDFGFNRTNLTIAERGIPMLMRSINVGGQSVTKRIMEQMKVTEGEAEQIKRDLGVSHADVKMPPVLEAVMQPIVHEIRYTFELFAHLESSELKKIDKIILTGGSSVLPHVPEYISSALNVNTYIGDPWARVVYPQDLRSTLDEIGPRMAVAVGLAMREIQ